MSDRCDRGTQCRGRSGAPARTLGASAAFCEVYAAPFSSEWALQTAHIGRHWAECVASAQGSQQWRARQSRETTGLPSWPRSGRCGVAGARRNLQSKRLNGGCILGHVLAVTVGHAPSGIRAISTDDDVRRSTKSMDRCWREADCGRPVARDWSGGHLVAGVPGARLTHGGLR
jgi:hypothetical protein